MTASDIPPPRFYGVVFREIFWGPPCHCSCLFCGSMEHHGADGGDNRCYVPRGDGIRVCLSKSRHLDGNKSPRLNGLTRQRSTYTFKQVMS